MSEPGLNILEAIRIALDAEQRARALYVDAVSKTTQAACRKLFEQLADFERYHFDKLTALEKSLREKGAFISYEGREMPATELRPFRTIEDPDNLSVMQIVTLAIEEERKAEKRYTDLIPQTADPEGQAMFKQLAKEEHAHQRTLREAYFILSNRGTL